MSGVICRHLPQRLQDGIQQELELDAHLRQAVTEAGEKLAGLLQQKEYLQSANNECNARKAGVQEQLASLQSLFSNLKAEKVLILALSLLSIYYEALALPYSSGIVTFTVELFLTECRMLHSASYLLSSCCWLPAK